MEDPRDQETLAFTISEMFRNLSRMSKKNRSLDTIVAFPSYYLRSAQSHNISCYDVIRDHSKILKRSMNAGGGESRRSDMVFITNSK